MLDDLSCPSAEAERLRAVAAYSVSEGEREADFDHFAALAAEILGTAVGLVNIVGKDDVLVHGRFGIDVASIPRSVAFCTRTVGERAPVVVPDLADDPRFVGNPIVGGDTGFRFYAGAPLIDRREGHCIGTLCVADPAPRPALSLRDTRLLTGLAALTMDRMELRRAERDRREAAGRFERMAAAASGAVICADRTGAITHWNVAAERLFGWSGAEALGRSLDIIVPEELRAAHRAGFARLVARADRDFPGRTVELPALRRDGTRFPAEITMYSWWEDGAPCFGAMIRDITVRRSAEEDRLRHLAHHDPLTGCANRAKLAELVAAAMLAPSQVGMALLDLDGFKHVNDTLGHAAGDALLVEAARRMASALGQSGTLARLGGDEFAAILPGCGDLGQARRIARSLQDSLQPVFVVSGRSMRMGASAGVSIAHGARAAGLLVDADLALHRAKAGGPGGCCVFDEAMRADYIARRALEHDVADAARTGAFELHYQPQVCLARNILVGAEALLRWRHPERGVLAPAAFLDALEAGPMAGAVGDWVVDQGCRQAAAWRRAGIDLRVGVNLFAEQLRAGNLESTVRDALLRWSLPPEALELEVTETIAFRQDDGLLAPLHALHAHGVGIAFDDFGTGFASLSTLKRCPLSRLKIDRGFVSQLGTAGTLGGGRDQGDVTIVSAVLSLGRGLGLGVVAEGVETKAQEAFLRTQGCDEAQGYLYGRPVPAAEMLGALPRWITVGKAARRRPAAPERAAAGFADVAPFARPGGLRRRNGREAASLA